MGPMTDPHVFWALARALQTLPVKLTELQAQKALDPLLEQMGQTTVPYNLVGLARGAASAGGPS